MSGIILSIAILAALYLWMLAPRLSHRRQMKTFSGTKWAHRGLHCMDRGIPENSMAAFGRAVREGLGIELDVHLTKDKKLAVFHDDTLERMCGKQGKIENLFYTDIADCYLDGTAEKIPLLSDVLAYVRGRVPLLIEIKLPDKNTAICVELAKALQEYTGAFLIQSFNCLALRWFKKHQGNILRGQLSSNLVKSDSSPHRLMRYCVKYLLGNCLCRPDFISYKLEDAENMSLWILKKFLVPVAVWTIRTSSAMLRAQKGYDMYIFENMDAGGTGQYT